MADKLTVNESLSVVSDPLRLHELYSPWNSPGQNTGVDSLSLLWGIFLTQVKPRSPALQADSLPVELPGKPHKLTVLLLLLLSHFSRVRLCATPQTATHQAGVGGHFLLQCMKVKSKSDVTQSCPTLNDPMDYSPPGSSAYGIFQARVLEWGAIAFSEIGVQVLYNVVLASTVQQCESAIHIHTSLPSWVSLPLPLTPPLQVITEP